MTPQITVVIPCYNEEESVGEAYSRLTGVMSAVGRGYELLFIDDGSADGTAGLIRGFAEGDASVRLIRFSRNFGHMAAITAGLDNARGDAVVIIDADMQDPPEVIPEMIAAWEAGNDVVYGVRRKREGEGLFKKWTAKAYYRLLKSITSVDLPLDAGEFRLISRKVCDAMKTMRERSRYMRGLISWVGFRQTAVTYDRGARFAGETKYPLRKMIRFAIDGIASFSYMPLKLATTAGGVISALSFIYLLIALYKRFFTDDTVQGWTSTVVIVLFTQGVVLMVLGLMGEYIGRIFDEIKGRPLYIVQETVGGGEGHTPPI